MHTNFASSRLASTRLRGNAKTRNAKTILPALLLKEMEQHASSSSNEVCGFVYESHYAPLTNLSGTANHFYGDPSGLARILSQYGEPRAIFHTHPNGCLELSTEDRRMWYYCNSTMIVGCITNGRLRWKMYGKRGD
ncbi:hypothetical protein L0222_00420 [bacterium]|nr:hypothetical protein [bacterium]MCI0605069.1 hypothetical protein [bacterium]